MRVEPTARRRGARPTTWPVVAPRRRFAAALLYVAVLASLTACGDDPVDAATVITPVYGDPCQYQDCSGHGECSAGAGDVPECTCDVGFGGSDCSSCGNGFHLDSEDRCVPDRSCSDQQQDPCGLYGSCDDHLGVVSCQCDAGYEGPRCELCAAGHERNPRGECVATVLVQGLSMQPGTAVPADGSGENSDSGSNQNHDGSNQHDAGSDQNGMACQDIDCGEHGRCVDDRTLAVCSCDDGYQGDACDACADGFHDSSGACVPNQACAANSCSSHGQCDAHTGAIVCSCDPGYGGSSCGTCAANFHPGAGGACDPNERCQTNSCPGHSTCDHSTGLIQCTCDDGYEGGTCDGCSPGYYRFYSTGTCELVECTGGTPPPAITDNFDDLAGDPAIPSNVCITDGNGTLARGMMTVMSTGGDSDVYVCGPSTLYALSSPASPHVFVDAGTMLPAKLVFARPIGKLSFDHAAISDTVSVDVLADGVVVGSISTHRRDSGSASYTFPAPITVLSFLSKAASKCTIAFDNIVYEPACP